MALRHLRNLFVTSVGEIFGDWSLDTSYREPESSPNLLARPTYLESKKGRKYTVKKCLETGFVDTQGM